MSLPAWKQLYFMGADDPNPTLSRDSGRHTYPTEDHKHATPLHPSPLPVLALSASSSTIYTYGYFNMDPINNSWGNLNFVPATAWTACASTNEPSTATGEIFDPSRI
jgi:hypothetical protein